MITWVLFEKFNWDHSDYATFDHFHTNYLGSLKNYMGSFKFITRDIYRILHGPIQLGKKIKFGSFVYITWALF